MVWEISNVLWMENISAVKVYRIVHFLSVFGHKRDFCTKTNFQQSYVIRFFNAPKLSKIIEIKRTCGAKYFDQAKVCAGDVHVYGVRYMLNILEVNNTKRPPLCLWL